jgi:hypothetical protein
MKTPEELQRLKDHWSRDPCYPLEDAEGFEQHRAELLAYSEQWKAAQWQREWEERLVRKATQLGCPGNLSLARYVLCLEDRLERLERKVFGE